MGARAAQPPGQDEDRNGLTGVLVGLGCLRLLDLQRQGPALHHITGARAGAVAASLGLTVAIMIIGRVPHPPATATTLVVTLGLITSATGVVALMAGVVLLAAQGILIDRVVGIDYPLWASSKASPLNLASPGPQRDRD